MVRAPECLRAHLLLQPFDTHEHMDGSSSCRAAEGAAAIVGSSVAAFDPPLSRRPRRSCACQRDRLQVWVGCASVSARQATGRRLLRGWSWRRLLLCELSHLSLQTCAKTPAELLNHPTPPLPPSTPPYPPLPHPYPPPYLRAAERLPLTPRVPSALSHHSPADPLPPQARNSSPNAALGLVPDPRL